ncbi:MAG TPA: TonB-dependent receptor, partial [Chitinophagales bacterium]|nr:TonB-dependent receptor [Chitinophagales bacterium]
RNNFAFTYDSLHKFSVTVEAGYDFERAVIPSYRMVRQRHIGKLVAGVKYTPVKQLVGQVKLRQSIYDKMLSPLAPLLTVSYKDEFYQGHKVSLTLNASRAFRFPTLNDLYWVPGGNPNLKPEKGWDGELSGRYAYRYYFSFTATGFAKYITNWIQWTTNGSYWEPRNVKRVFTRGVELQAWACTQSIGRFSAMFVVNYTYTRATNLDPLSPYDLSLNKQLIYVPLHQVKGSAQFYYRRFYLKAINTFTDAVFITTDNSQALKGYYLLDLEVGKDFEIRDKYELGVSFRANNVTNRQYQNVAQRPMPGVNFEGTLKFRFNR